MNLFQLFKGLAAQSAVSLEQMTLSVISDSRLYSTTFCLLLQWGFFTLLLRFD